MTLLFSAKNISPLTLEILAGNRKLVDTAVPFEYVGTIETNDIRITPPCKNRLAVSCRTIGMTVAWVIAIIEKAESTPLSRITATLIL
jgi:hypothetical protein